MSEIAAPYKRALTQAVVLYCLWLGFSQLILDTGEFLSAVIYSSIAFWIGVVLVVVRRPLAPTRGDLYFIRWGIIPIVAMGVAVFTCVWHWKGVL